MPVSRELLQEVALSPDEYELIVRRLGREPSLVELGLFGSLWSEHCGYQHSRPLLGRFPTEGRRVLVRIGEENAGAVDIGDGLCIVMKVESHNHPSAIEPYQGAATGVGGIVRDVFTMGARPIALLNSLRFGPLDEPRNRYLLNGVVGGIAGYGNCLGIPDVGGEVFFESCYSHNPLVNAMCVGLARSDGLVRARAQGAGNLLMLVGADTGRDGLHGASGLASRTFEDERELRSTVQVGNPFMEKLLIEACLELVGMEGVVGIQDLGAAGLTSAAVESVSRGGGGLWIDVAKVPRREEGMNAYEVMLSESQERMLVIVRPGWQERVQAVFDKWELRSDLIGEVTDDGIARIRDGAETVAEAPVALLTDPPLYRYRVRKPAWLARLQRFDLDTLPDVAALDAEGCLLTLLSSPNIASKEYIYRQYDHQVQTNTVVSPGGDAAVLRVKGTGRGIALATDGNGRYCYLDPYRGGAIAVAEAARNVVVSGARPIAITDCLNMGNPERPEVYYQLKECIRGMARACRVLGTPVVSGNVSLYNETRGEAVYPTPVVGMLGLIEDVDRRCAAGFKEEGDVVILLGAVAAGTAGLAASEYLELVHGIVAGRPDIDLGLERGLQRLCLAAIGQGLVRSAHDCSDGGLAVALAECAIMGGVGVHASLGAGDGRADALLFGELSSRVVVSTAPGQAAALEGLAARHAVPCQRIGVVGGTRLVIDGFVDVPLGRAAGRWRRGLEEALA